MVNDKRKKDSARLTWDSKPRRAPNPKDIEFQTAEMVIPNPHRDEAQIPMSFRDGFLGEKEIDKQKINRLIWGDNLLAMQALLAQGYEGKINLIYIDPPFDSKTDYSHKMTISPTQSSLGSCYPELVSGSQEMPKQACPEEMLNQVQHDKKEEMLKREMLKRVQGDT